MIISIPFTLFFETIASGLGSFMTQLGAQIWTIAIAAPLVEEFAKGYPLFYRHGETGRSIFTLGLLVGLGFGIAEYIIYVFIYGIDPVIRVFGIFFHAATASIIAYGIYKKKTLLFYVIVVLLHSANNLSAILGSVWFIVGTSSVLISYVMSLYFHSKIKNRYY